MPQHRGGDPILEAVGWVAAAGAAMEWALTDLHETLLGGPHAHVQVAGETFDAALQACRRLIKHIEMRGGRGELAARVRTAVNAAAVAWEERGAVVHGLWWANDDTEQLPRQTSYAWRMRRTGLEEKTYTVEDLYQIADRLRAASDALALLETEIREQELLRGD